MEIQLERQNATNAIIKVNLTEADYRPKVSEKLKEYSKKAQLKGFRPGKVPTSLIQKMYGKSILVDEINHLLGDSLNKYIKENNLPIIGDPLPHTDNSDAIDWDNQKSFSFDYNVGLVPEFHYQISEGLDVTIYDIETTPEVVQETLDNLRSQFGKTEEVETVANGDIIEGTLLLGDETKSVTIHSSKLRDGQIQLFVGKNKLDKLEVEPLNLFEDQAALAHMLGISVDEAKEISGIGNLTIDAIKRNNSAELDQEFFDKIFGAGAVATEEEFMIKLEETIKQNYQRESEQVLKKNIQDAFLNTVTIDLPNDFLKRWLLVTNQGKITKEQIENEYEFYLKELRWTLIKNKIASDHNITIEEQDIKQRAKDSVLQQFGNMKFEPEMEDTFNKITDNYLKQDKGKNYMKLYDELMLERITALILEQAQPKRKTLTVKEFKALE